MATSVNRENHNFHYNHHMIVCNTYFKTRVQELGQEARVVEGNEQVTEYVGDDVEDPGKVLITCWFGRGVF